MFLVNCEYFSTKPNFSIARVNDKYLFFNEIQDKIPANLSKEDSIVFVRNQINSWAKKHILNQKSDKLKVIIYCERYFINNEYIIVVKSIKLI